MSLLAHFETATVVRCFKVALFWSQQSLADSTTQRANGFFFSFNLAKLRGYFYLIYYFIYYFTYLYKPAGLKTPKASPQHWLGVHGPYFSKIGFSGFTCPAVVFSYFYVDFFYDTCILNVFLTNKVYCLGLHKLRVGFFG